MTKSTEEPPTSRNASMAAAEAASQCIFCQIASKSTSTTLLHTVCSLSLSLSRFYLVWLLRKVSCQMG
ncbi:hypothetical protein GBA52_015919 [Prunus armeniaca]|nr:hypothetical protein GBA52_015919 [Prunus armeniaca]